MQSILGTPNHALAGPLGALVELLAPGCDSDRAARIIAQTPDLLDAARRHRVIPLLYDRWDEQFARTLSPAGHDAWRQAFLWHMPLCHARRREAAEFLQALAGAGITTVVMRGLWLADAVYLDPVLRPHADIDIIVPPADAPRVGPVLEALGYGLRRETRLMAAWRAGRSLSGGDYDTWGSWARDCAGSLPIVVDVHVGLQIAPAYWWPFRPDFDTLLTHAEPWEIEGVPARCLALHYAVLAQCENIARHSVGRLELDDQLVRYHDLRLLLPRLSPANWEALYAEARALRVGLPIWLAATRTADLWGLHLPPDLRDRLRVPAGAERLARGVLHPSFRLGHLARKSLFQVAVAGNAFVALSYLARNLAPALRAASSPSHRTMETP